MHTIEKIIDAIIRVEGDYNDLAQDKGGATNKGISLKYLRGVGLIKGDLNHDGTIDKEDIKLVDHDRAYEFYMQDFYLVPRLNKLPMELQPLMVDMAVNHGPPRAIILLQKTLAGKMVQVDGVCGPGTCAEAALQVRSRGWKSVNNALVRKRLAFYDAIIAEDHSQAVFEKGWKARANSFLE